METMFVDMNVLFNQFFKSWAAFYLNTYSVVEQKTIYLLHCHYLMGRNGLSTNSTLDQHHVVDSQYNQQVLFSQIQHSSAFAVCLRHRSNLNQTEGRRQVVL